MSHVPWGDLLYPSVKDQQAKAKKQDEELFGIEMWVLEECRKNKLAVHLFCFDSSVLFLCELAVP